MTRLAPCPSCGRHVVVSEASCPFCHAAFDAPLVPKRGNWDKTIGRVGAIAVAGALAGTGCGGAMPEYGAPAPMDAGDGDGDAGTGVDAGDGDDAGIDAGLPAAEYGAPPEP